jgi:hypothetical protein
LYNTYGIEEGANIKLNVSNGEEPLSYTAEKPGVTVSDRQGGKVWELNGSEGEFR